MINFEGSLPKGTTDLKTFRNRTSEDLSLVMYISRNAVNALSVITLLNIVHCT